MATARSIMKQLQSALTCYICQRSFLNPATLDCGHNFCHSCILTHWQESGSEAACPSCQEKILRISFPLNKQLVNIVQLTQDLADQVRRAAGRQERCQEHQEARQSFCMDDLVLFCSACDASRDHQSHRVLPAEKAAEDYKHHFLTCATILQKEKEKIYKNDSAEETECMKLSKQMFKEKNAMVAELEELQRFVAEQETFLRTEIMEKTEKDMTWRKSVRTAVLFREELTFDDIIRELKEKDGEPPLDLLQDIRDPLEKCKKKFLDIETFPVQLKMHILEQLDLSFFMRSVVYQFKGILLSGYQTQKANVTLDPDTAHPRLILSEDRKSLRLGSEHQNLAEDDRRFDLLTCILGYEQFIARGRYYWDVVLGGTGSWAVGVAKKSLRRKGLGDFLTQEGVWVMFRINRTQGFIGAGNDVFVPVRQRIKRIRVYLNYIAGQIAFCDPDKGVMLHVCTKAFFLGEPVLPFFWIHGRADLSLPF
uniref:E3 ubiquitin-protein ligase TRIM7-like n=1 Tax=Pogona vitticeps TaxID=103695 RepID=A0A6J0SKI0_9SAUR